MDSPSKEELKGILSDRDFKLVFKNSELMKKYNACYRVEYEGDLVYPPAADRLGIPKNEIWIHSIWKDYEKYILYHELKEIEYRIEGYSVEKAHELAVKDNTIWEEDPKFEKFKKEINIASEEELTKIKEIDTELFDRIMKSRPIYDMGELNKVNGLDGHIIKDLKEKGFWCIYEENR
ncbi:MAG: hypothetical protein ACOC5D_02105 [Thermoplasmatota archaeon]